MKTASVVELKTHLGRYLGLTDIDDLMPVRLPKPVDGLRDLMRDRERR